MVKVLVVVKALEVTGVSNVIMNYYKNINRAFIEMGFVTGERISESYKSEIQNNGDELYILKGRDSNPIKYIFKLASIIRKNKYNIVHVHGNSSMIFIEMIAAFMGGAKIRIAHSHNTTSNHVKIEKILRPLFYTFYTHGIACGQAAGKWMFGKRKFLVLNNGINLTQYSYSEKKRNLIRDKMDLEGKTVIGHVGAFNYQKNHEFLINMFANLLETLPNAVLILVGTGDTMPTIKEIVVQKGIERNVVFYGLSDDVASLMMAMDVFILPSRFEGLPCVLIEAQALGLPCIVSNNISKESSVSNLVTYLSLKDPLIKWNKAITESISGNRYKDYLKAKKKVEENGYNIKTSVKKLESFYIEASDPF